MKYKTVLFVPIEIETEANSHANAMSKAKVIARDNFNVSHASEMFAYSCEEVKDVLSECN